MKAIKAITLILIFTLTSIQYGFADCITLTVVSTNVLCNGDSSGTATVVVISGGIPPYSFDWSTGATTQTANGLAAGIYTVTVTDSTGTCTGDTSVTINEPLPITISLSSSAASCPTCCDVCVSMNITGGCIPYTYAWTPVDPNWPFVCSGCAGTTYTVTIFDSCGCTAKDSITPDTVPIVGIDGTRQRPQGELVTIYPNPAHSQLYIKGSFDVPASFELYDIMGRIVLSQSIHSNQPINISQLSKGLYVYQIKTPDVSVRGKFIKQ